MRIDGYHMGQIGSVYQNQKLQQTPIEQVQKPDSTRKVQDLNQIRDVYEPTAAQVKVNFGGYDKNGRASTPRVGGYTPNTPVANDFSTAKPATSLPSGTILEGYQNLLQTDEEGLSVKMKGAGLAVEDLVYPERASQLSEDAQTKNQLADFALNERSSLLAESGMSGKELDAFVSAVRG